jgi:RHS repeat-associated protein
MGVTLVATLAAAISPPAAVAAVTPKKPQETAPVPGGTVPVKPPRTGATQVLSGSANVQWPAASTTEVALTNTAAKTAGVVSLSGAAAAPAKVKVEVLGQDASAKAGVAGVLLKVGRTDGVKAAGPVTVSVDYNGFRDAYGGDWASRLRLVPLTGNASVGSVHNDPKAGKLTADVQATGDATTFAVAAAPEGPSGDYKATSLSASAAWQVSNQTGAFTWNYPLRVPPVPGSLSPSLSASYNSANVDGRVAGANSQTSWLGEGWDLSPGFIERRYKSCAEDLGGNQGQEKTGDLCWGVDNATVSLGNHSGELVRNGTTDYWRLKNDDGTRVEHLYGTDNGEYWRLTTTDGMQYYFGKNKIDGRPDTQSAWTVPVAGNNDDDPCHKTAFADSFCAQAYRWNLDYVVDTRGNAMTYNFTKETNNYGQNLAKAVASYVRGGTLREVDYGIRDKVAGDAPARMIFDVVDRCAPGQNCATHNRTSWPDVPFEQECTGTTCPDKYAPTFWSTKRLNKVTTQILGGSDACVRVADKYCGVEQWTFNQTYPVPGDSSDPALWLDSITHTGLVGVATAAISLPAVTFVADPNHKANRVNTERDGFLPNNKNRIYAIQTESGGEIDINYKAHDCKPGTTMPAPDSNTLRCFPVRWAPDKVDAVDDWFYKYVVDSVGMVDRVGGAPTQFTSYDYEGDAAWAYNDDPLVDEKYRTWSNWRGYSAVQVRKGDPRNPGAKQESATRYRYFRGMNGDKKAGGTKPDRVDGIADLPQYAGFLREQVTLDGPGGNEVKATVNNPWSRGPTSTQGNVKAYYTNTDATYGRETLSGGRVRKTETHTTFGDGTQLGDVALPTQVNDLGDVDDPNDDRCTTTAYAINTASWLVNLPKTEKTVGGACEKTATLPQDAISDTRTFYDDNGLDEAPEAGNKTRVEDMQSTGYVATSHNTYDSYGRVVDSFDAMDHKSTKAYTNTNGLLKSSTDTNALGHTTTTTYEPAWNVPVNTKDANESQTDATYDSLGRVTAVWQPGRSKAGGFGPTTRYAYGLRGADGATWVTTDQLKPNNNYVTTLALYDGFLRPRQTQAPSPVGGRQLTDTIYDTRGLVAKTNSVYYNDKAPDKTLFAPEEAKLPNQTVNEYDGAERKTKEAYQKFLQPQWSTTSIYNGDSTTVLPPDGGSATTTFTNARGLTTELREYYGSAATGTYNATKKSYTKAGELKQITDAVNNVWTNDYDVAGNQIGSADPDKGNGTTTYNKANQPVSTTDARGQVTAIVYDDLGRRTELHKDTPAGDLLAKWTYDTVKKGQLSSTTRYVGGQAYVNSTTSYDAANRPQDVEVTIPASEGALKGTYKTHTSYNVDGSVASVVLPKLGAMAEETLTYGYDTLGLLKTTKGKDTYVSATAYTALGEVSQYQLGVDGKRVWQTVYYEEGTRRVSDALIEREDATAKVDEMAYTYDKVGNVKKIEDTMLGQAVDRQCVNYDGLRRLTDAWTSTQDCATAGASVGGPAAYWNTYDNDAVGRRRSQTQHGIAGASDTTSTMTYPDAGQPQPHAPKTLSTAGPLRAMSADGTYEYDASGNTKTRPTSAGGQSYDWDTEGQLASVTVAGKKTSYVNTPDNIRLLSKQDGAGATLYLPSGELQMDQAGNLTGTRYYVQGDNSVAARTPKGVTYLSGDHQGTSNLAVDAATLAPTKRRFDPFGVPRGAAPVVWPGQRGFVGGAGDPATGLTRLGVRDYDANTGKFVTVDPVLGDDNPQQLNAYAYSLNNPTTLSDPNGARPICNNQGDCIVGHDTGVSDPTVWPAERAAREDNARKYADYIRERTKPRPKTDKSYDGDNLRVGIHGPSWAEQEAKFMENLYGAIKASHDNAWAPDGFSISVCGEIPIMVIFSVSGCVAGDGQGVAVQGEFSTSVPDLEKLYQAHEWWKAAQEVATKALPNFKPELSFKVTNTPIQPGTSSGMSVSVPTPWRFGVEGGFDKDMSSMQSLAITIPPASGVSSEGTWTSPYLFRWSDLLKPDHSKLGFKK